MTKEITVAYGDGIGPEIMDTTLRILKEAEAKIRVEIIEVGEKLYNKHYTSGIANDTWDALARTKVLLKSPITTPLGGGYKSLNVTMRKKLGLFANIRSSVGYAPFVKTLHPDMDLVIVRENEEDIYAGIEYRQTHNMYSSLKLISELGSEKIIRYAFEYAIKNNRKKVTCFSKDNIMKFSDGIFHKTFNKISEEYKNFIKSDHMIIDIGTAKLANQPSKFDVIVTSNLYGDIISDVTAEISGSVGMAGSSNIGEEYAMFEAVHGSAPDIADQNIANPSGLINAAVMMLLHIGDTKAAENIENAWKKTIEDGIHTGDIYNDKTSSKKVGTREFGEAVIKNLGAKPSTLKAAEYKQAPIQDKIKSYSIKSTVRDTKTLVGVDIFFDFDTDLAEKLAHKIESLSIPNLILKTISSKGLKLWPGDSAQTVSDHWCCRFMNKKEGATITHKDIADLFAVLEKSGLDFIKSENLYNFGEARGYSLAQGE
jgi:isocitrate dehydrogenase